MRGPTTSGSPGLRLVRDVTVVVPAHDEADGIAACLASVDAAAAAIAPVPVRVVIVLDDCADATADLARAFAPTAAAVAVAVEVRTVRLRRVGAVRAAGFAGGPRGARSWYATTDADSLVPSSWLRAHLLSAGRHDMFVGTVDVVDWSPRPLGLAAAYAARYQRASSHRHVHATNLGVRASTYWQVGGFIDAGAHEDVALVSAVEAAGGVVDWSSAEPVVTSARRSGRTPTGFSEYLNRLESGRPA